MAFLLDPSPSAAARSWHSLAAALDMPAHPPGVPQGSVCASWASGGEYRQVGSSGGARAALRAPTALEGGGTTSANMYPRCTQERGQGAGGGHSRWGWDCGHCLFLLPHYLLFCCLFLKYTFNEDQGEPVFLQTRLFTHGK